MQCASSSNVSRLQHQAQTRRRLLRRFWSASFYDLWFTSCGLRFRDSLRLGRGLTAKPARNKADKRQEQCREDCQNRPETHEGPRETFTPIDHSSPSFLFF